MAFDWYEICELGDSSLEQGDFVPECPIVVPPSSIAEGNEVDVEVQLIDSIIMSQSCDLDNGKIDIVLVCPYYNLRYWIENALPTNERTSKKAQKKAIENLKRGYLPGYHLLQKCPNHGLEDWQVVDFRNVYGINFDLLQNIVSKTEQQRLRLLSPYKEHLSQAFARYFMRVGLPSEIIVEGY